MLRFVKIMCDCRTCTRPGCGPIESCKGHTWREIGPFDAQVPAESWIVILEPDDVAITIRVCDGRAVASIGKIPAGLAS